MISFPNTTNVGRIADWTELFVLTENKSISKLKIQNLFEEEGIDVESKMDDVINELTRRVTLYGANSPIKINGVKVEPEIRWKENPIHTLCLIFSTFGVEDVSDGGTKLFERIGVAVLKEFLNSEIFHVGFPNSTNLKQQLDDVAIASHEPRGALTPDLSEKDSGVDVISWVPFNDTRSGQVIVLAQCGAGDDWRNKDSIMLNTWNHYINWNYETTVPSMVITQIVQAEKWLKYTNKYGVLIDRARLFRMYSLHHTKLAKPLIREVETWCKAKLS